MTQQLFDKVAIVTGASRGIGAAIALELAGRGANLVMTYNSNRAEAEAVAAKVQQLGRRGVICQACGTDRAAPEAIVAKAVKAFGHIDIIVNNAGWGEDAFITELTHELWDKTFETNVRMPTFLIKAALPHLGKNPRIVNISSVAARGGFAGMTAYSGTKGAMESITRVLATELGQEYNLTINCVNPGPVATDMWLRDTDPVILKAAEPAIQATPAGARIANVEDIAPIVAFLCSEESRWSTGSVVNANGGSFFV